ncbi:MAG: biotin transport system substrate-specific component [Clostridia bacterium]|nr:biotin transport system substrate-specific component [Clostridia bacterium]
MKLSVRDMVLVAFFAALMAVGAYISKIWPPDIVPFSLLPLLSMLAGVIIGPRLGALSIVVYILVGLIGVPVFASPPYGGFTYILKPTFGFLISFAVGAYIAGLLVHKKEKPGWGTFLSAMLTSTIVMYVIGLPWMYLVFNFYLGKPFTFMQIITMMSLYMGLDLIKALLAAIVGKTLFERVTKQVTSLQYNRSR